MSTIYDVVAVILFAGLAILFLQRSSEPPPHNDRIFHYLPPAIACAAANWLGNNHYDIAAVAMLVGGLVYTYFVLKPFKRVP